MRVLIACEFSGTVRRAFADIGKHTVWSCDLLPSDDGSPWHHRGDIFDFIRQQDDFDLMIAHPPCTHLAVSGAAWFHKKIQEQADALNFVRRLMELPMPKCIENPVSVISSKIRKPDQIIQPYQFGHAERKTTCLWLENLPKLQHTSDLKAETLAKNKNKQNPLHYLPPSQDRWKERSRTYNGIAQAMANQWG